ncbi:methyltransferase [Actinoplanes sp. NPDC051475]|jgi:SAM-dependent methyltransferase|uniref:methyltransferase n=1 Tax=Actinoplanes sp. NPDC051475 TaxID=3157225 RepID=UPI00344E79EB
MDVRTPPAPAALMELTTGLWASQTLAAAEHLGLFTVLSRSGGASVAETAHRLGIEERPAEILLTACAALDLLSRDGGRYVNTPLAETYLVRGGQYYFGDYVRMLTEYVYPGWTRLADAIHANAPARVTTREQQEIFEATTRPKIFWDGLYPLSALTARALAEAVDLEDVTSVLDVGGGNAAFAIELCRFYPELRATVFDLPFVCRHTADRVADAGLSERVALHPGDFFADADLPGGHDAILLSMILHDWDEPRNAELLAKCHRALPSGGLLMISELLVDDDKTGPRDAALMSMNMLVGTWGRNYTVAEYRDWLAAAGFTGIRTVRFSAPGANGAVLARKP